VEIGGQRRLYTAPDCAVKVDVFVKDETVWLTQEALADLFEVKVPAITQHLKNTFDSGELTRVTTVSKTGTVRTEGVREVEFHNLDAIDSAAAERYSTLGHPHAGAPRSLIHASHRSMASAPQAATPG
jgi:hypothetical protein